MAAGSTQEAMLEAGGPPLPGLRYADDGSLTITIASFGPPSGAANWLPSPAGEFHLMLGLHWPVTVLAGNWAPPPVTPVEGPAATDQAPTPTKRDDS